MNMAAMSEGLQLSRQTKLFSIVFIGRNHIPKSNITFPLVLSDKRRYRNLTFRNVLARQDSSYCNRARLNLISKLLRCVT